MFLGIIVPEERKYLDENRRIFKEDIHYVNRRIGNFGNEFNDWFSKLY